jgi:hypothetical protein
MSEHDFNPKRGSKGRERLKGFPKYGRVIEEKVKGKRRAMKIPQVYLVPGKHPQDERITLRVPIPTGGYLPEEGRWVNYHGSHWAYWHKAVRDGVAIEVQPPAEPKPEKPKTPAKPPKGGDK